MVAGVVVVWVVVVGELGVVVTVGVVGGAFRGWVGGGMVEVVVVVVRVGVASVAVVVRGDEWTAPPIGLLRRLDLGGGCREKEFNSLKRERLPLSPSLSVDDAEEKEMVGRVGDVV